jgi:nucleoid DNA-binding protein
MTMADIIKEVAKQLDVHPFLVKGFVWEALEHVRDALDSGKEVKIRGIGTFSWKPIPGRPVSGARVGSIPPGKKLKFTPSLRLRNRRPNIED